MHPTVDDIHRLSADIWGSVLGLDVVPDAAARLDPDARTVTGSVHITGAWTGSVTVQCAGALAVRATALMFGMEEDEVGADEVDDALGEVTNMTGGSYKSLLAGTCALSLPMVVRGRDCSVTVPGSTPVHEVLLSCDGEALVVCVLEHRDGAPSSTAALGSAAALPISR
jgi:CheY-specific phosphatase CheX